MDAKTCVERLRKKYKTNDIYYIAEKMGVIIHRVPLGTTRGMCYHARRIKQIFLNIDMPPNIEMFVLAHELGHLVMHPKHNAPFLQNTFFNKNRYEIEANTFAINLIMSDLDIMEHWEYTIDEWAMFYGLPREIIELRFK